ncbi:MAG: GatB/YqeY domain-containing protein [Bacteroidaceae bacterium]|nr:GatB/YqeY domain-containing protein [Bacteroidaceae bacterium]
MLFDQISKDILAAMKAKDKARTMALRNAKKYFIEAKTAPGANDTLDDAAALKILQKLVKQGEDTAQLYTEQNRPDLAEEEMSQVVVLKEYLPKQMSAEELEACLKQIIVEVGAQGPRDMGKVMGAAQKSLAGKADGRAIADTVKRLLNQ